MRSCMEDTSLTTGTDASAEPTWRNTCSPTRWVPLTHYLGFTLLMPVLFFSQFDQKLALAPGFVVPSNLDYKVKDV